ncbi:MAG: DUF86 domain-containing protein [Gammaproteobacteria bacterium]|nr:DUF86 domain-containing protein [Gammaproteobacteria bacterium]
MKDDVIVNKVETIERCIKRIQEEYIGFETEFKTNYTKQDAIILNLQRACEATIDIGMRMIRLKELGIPQSTREVFVKLEEANIISQQLSQHLQAMVGFRNIAVHDYSRLNLEIVRVIVEDYLQDLRSFCKIALEK